MKLELNMSNAEIDVLNREVAGEIDRLTLVHLTEVCGIALKIQRAKMKADGGYQDQTGQLRSSTGYIIYHNGKVVHEDFELSPYGTDKAPGLKQGRELALSQLRSSEGWGILLVAGMEYAEWVEGKGLTVLSSATEGLGGAIVEAFSRIVVE